MIIGTNKANLLYYYPTVENILNLGFNENIKELLLPEISGETLHYDDAKYPKTYFSIFSLS